MKTIFKNLKIDEFLLVIFQKKTYLILLLLFNIFFIFASTIFLIIKDFQIEKSAVRYADQIGYYSYLPALVTEKDLSFKFIIDDTLADGADLQRYDIKFNTKDAGKIGYHEIIEGIYANKYPLGVALLLLPFYLIAHVATILFNLEQNGWAIQYQLMCVLGALNYLLVGLYFLFQYLQKFFKPWHIVLSFILIVFGTNLIDYGFLNNMFSHVFSFSFISIYLYLIDRYYTKQNINQNITIEKILIGVVFGLLMIIRPANFLLVLLFPLWEVNTLNDMLARIKFLFKNYKDILLIGFVVLLTMLPLFLYWKYAFGSFIAFSYKGEFFDFTRPYILEVLFSTQKGLFFWSPILIFSIIGLLIIKIKNYSASNNIINLFIFLLLQTYLIASWWSWQYGESYGHRAFVDFYPIFIMGLAGCMAYIASQKMWIKSIVWIIIVLLFALNCFQYIQFVEKIIPPADTSWTEYKRIFLSLDEEDKFFWKERPGW